MKKLISLTLIFLLIMSAVPTFAAEPATSPFTDLPVAAGNGYLSVVSLVESGIIQGKTPTEFHPNDPITRAEVAKVIVLAAEEELVSATGTFIDVPADAWYVQYVETANAIGLMKGISATEFSPDANFSRQDAAVLAVRLAEKLGVEMESIYSDTAKDASEIAEYAKDAVDKCLKMNFADNISGNFKPLDAITRVDFCKIVDRVRISVPDAYDDILQDKLPLPVYPDESNSLPIVVEDFENGIVGMSETGPSAWGQKPSESIQQGVGKDGTNAIVLDKNNRIANLYLPIDAGTNYYISYDVKTNINEGAYFRAYFQYYANGVDAKSNSGSYDRNGDVTGDTDWRAMSFKSTAPTPDLMPDTLRIALMIEGKTGADAIGADAVAYIDNLKISKTVYYPMIAMMVSPSYKGLIYEENGVNDIVLNTFITGLGSLFKTEETYVEATIKDMDGNVVTSIRKDNPTPEMTVSLSSKELEVGEYCLDVDFKEKGTDKVIGNDYWILRKRPPDEERTRYYFDEHGRLVKDGEPIFMFGTYARAFDIENDGEYAYKDFTGTINVDFENSNGAFFSSRKHLDIMAENGSSIMVPTESKYSLSLREGTRDADVTNRASERVILERFLLNRGLVGESAVAGYMINDECPPDEWMDRIQWHNNIINSLDLDAPTFGVHIGNEEMVKQFWHSHDIYSSDAYPVGGKSTDKISRVYTSTKAIENATKNRPFWTVTQLSDLRTMGTSTYLAKNDRGPNEAEMRNMAWQSVCGGAQGICWYAHYDLEKEVPAGASGGPMREKDEVWAECVKVSDEVKHFEDAILSVEDIPVMDIGASVPDMFCSRIFRHEGKTYVAMVNMSMDASQSVSIASKGMNSAEAAYNHEFTLSDDAIELTLSPYDVEVLIIDQDEFLSHDTELDELQFSDGSAGYFVTIVDDVKTLCLPEGIDSITYVAKVNPKSHLTIDGEAAEETGEISVAGKGSITFSVVAENGTKSDYTYNIAREAAAQ